jgi:hypothetical protein
MDVKLEKKSRVMPWHDPTMFLEAPVKDVPLL